MAKTNRDLQKSMTRQHLLEIAFVEFGKKGLLATPTLDLARAAGVAHGTLFTHFPSREDLVVAVIEEFGARITQRLHELTEGGGGLREILAAHLQGIKEFEPFYTRLISELRLLPREARGTMVMIQSAISFHVMQSADWEMSSGKIRVLPFHLLFNQWLGLLHHYLMNGDLFAPGESVIARYGTELLDYYLNLLRT